ncbi:aspartate kinase [Aneurinibacillus sp. Ricciae_BoGa-3]|uniref:aspartate kinase n=1 Tax=Aneurinibacillus sp. Ricciae_BoGa-3 TaxID=3022697 RepID=UPI00234202E3|nr:aspartate kinase [Aneurinibacillus sp. Ricciae_BoGa-3]WCK53710.1 aspartate kinase [Aneurinibacillus sp. Ricciae_BoGa-3]
MALIVQKYGGTSVGIVERIQKVAQRIISTRNQGNDVIAVVSAMGKSTDVLVDMALQIARDPSERELDMLLSTGEQVTIALLAMALEAQGCNAVSMTGWQAGIRTEAVHTRARILEIDSTSVTDALAAGKVVIIAGFQGFTADGQITTLGRGGSDTTAVAVAAAAKADLCEIYTDVDGVYTADPRVVPQARKLTGISYDEMLELANLGAGVLHPRAVECAKQHNVPLTVRSSFGEEEGTLVKEEAGMEQNLIVSGVASDKSVAKITVAGMPAQVGSLSRLFTILAQEHINVDIIIQGTNGDQSTDISFSIHSDQLAKTLSVLEQSKETLKFGEILFEEGLAKVSIVGAGMITNPGVAADMFTSLAEAGVPIKMVSTSEIKVSCVIPVETTETAVRKLHTSFGLDAVAKAVVHSL